MAVTIVASAAKNEATPTTSLTITIPAGTQADDILVLAAANRGSASNPSVSDDDSGGNAWALMASKVADTSRSGSLWWKRATSGTASKTITVSGCTQACVGGVTVCRGADTGATPYEGVVSEENASANETQAEITVSDGSMVFLAVFNVVNDRTVTSQSCASPGALTQCFELLHTGAGTDCAVNLSSEVKSGAGGTGAFTWSQGDNVTASIAFGLKAAAAAAAAAIPFPRRDHCALLSHVRR